MKHIDGTLPGEKKAKIYYQGWLPSKPKAVVVLVHGVGEHSGRYVEVAEQLNSIGCAVYAIDHRGHGRSSGATSANIGRFRYLTADLDQLVVKARQEHRGKQLFLLGHSMGGAVSLSYTIQHQDRVDALILSGPAVSLDGAPAFIRVVSKLLSTFTPKLGLVPVDPSVVSRDPDKAADYAADPLNCHGKLPARTLGEIVKFVEWLPAVLPTLKLPLLVQHGGADKLAGPSGGKMVVDLASSKDKTFKLYDGLYHEIFNELPEDRARVFADLKAWITAHLR